MSRASSACPHVVSRDVFFTTLGFTAVVIQGVSGPDGASRATGFARLIEEFCRETIPNAFDGEHKPAFGQSEIDRKIESFKSGLIEHETALLPEDRASLLEFYDRLQTRKAQREQRAFYDAAPDAMIANRVLTLIDEEIHQDEESEP